MAGLGGGQRSLCAHSNFSRDFHRPAASTRAPSTRRDGAGALSPKQLDALGLSTENLASVVPASRAYQTWVPVTKFKHGKWKVKWKKVHREDADQYGLEDRAGDRDDWLYGEGRDD